MNTEHLAEVNRLNALREDAIAIRKEANDGRSSVVCRLMPATPGSDIDVTLRVCGTAYMRQAIIEACTDAIVKTEAMLAKLGVRVPHPEPIVEGTAAQWKRECGMYQMAWSRELGPRRPKSHLIDELVCGTRDLRTALAPFADYGSGAGRKLSADMQVSQGSNMAKRQLVMGDFHAAADAMGLR